MSDIFISYARSTATQAEAAAQALRALGYEVWRDDELPAHRDYSEVIEERLRAAKAVVVLWSAEAVKSHWVRAEADMAREAGTLVQLSLDGAPLPMPFNRIQCADLAGWMGDPGTPGWRKVVASVAALAGASSAGPAPEPVRLAPPPSKPSIAVMPFANLSGDPEQDYFADGMVVEIIEALSHNKSIFVIARGSSLSFKGKGCSPQDAARQLGVRYVLEGDVRKADGRVRIGVQLIDAADGAAILTQRFEGALDDVFALQDRVALSVAGKIEPTIQQAEIRRAALRPTENMGGYDLYLRALPCCRTGEKAGYSAAIGLLERAIDLDPDYGLALALAAVCHFLLVPFGWSDDPPADSRRSVELAHRALRAAGDDAQVLPLVALVTAYVEGDLAGALGLVDRAIALNPGSAIGWNYSGDLRLQAGDTELAIEHLETSMRLDPMGPDRATQVRPLGCALYAQGRFSEALAYFRELVQQQENPGGYFLLAAALGKLGQTAAAKEALAHYRALTPLAPAEFASNWSRTVRPELIQQWLDGIALAEGASPSPLPEGEPVEG